MVHRREALIRMGVTAFAPGMLGAMTPGAAQETKRRRPGRSAIDRPILFNTADADRILEDLQVFPPDNPWNADVSRWPLHPDSRKIIASIGADKPFRYNPDMAFVLVPPDQKRVPVRLIGYNEESDKGPYPVPDDMPIEGWPAFYRSDPKLRGLNLDDVQRDRKGLDGDRHAIVVDPVNRMLYEFYNARKTDAGWEAAQASVFDLKANKLRPDGWTSTDAAGLPLFPSIVRHDELRRGSITHALRVTVTRSRRSYVHPATHYASKNTDPDLPRMGERIRRRCRDFDTSRDFYARGEDHPGRPWKPPRGCSSPTTESTGPRLPVAPRTSGLPRPARGIEAGEGLGFRGRATTRVNGVRIAGQVPCSFHPRIKQRKTNRR